MARRTKTEKFDVDVEAALEAALNFNFDTINALIDEGVEAAKREDSDKISENTAESVITAAARQDDNDADLVQKSKIPTFAKKIAPSEKHTGNENRRFNSTGNLSNDVFDLKSLEQQIASAAEELNKTERKWVDADTRGTTGNLNAGSQTNATADKEGNTKKSRKYIVAGGILSTRNEKKAVKQIETNSTDKAVGNIKADKIQPVNENVTPETGALHQTFAKDQGKLSRLAGFLQIQKKREDNRETDKNSPFSFGTSKTRQNGPADNIRSQSRYRGGGDDELSSQGGPPSSPPKKRRIKDSFLRNPLYWTTAAVSALWAAGGIIMGYEFAAQNGNSPTSFLMGAQGLLVAAGTIVPIFMFWGFAQLACRAKELQKIVQTMTGAAMNLIEPDNTANERVSSLGHTIRHEIEAMDEGIDRTMSRASELEALLQSEVNNLERSYGENEVRIRVLIAELANEREAVATHADSVKAKITDAKDQLTQEFTSIADHINATAESFTITLSETLNSRWGELVNEFNNANEEVAHQLSQKFVDTVQSFDASRGQFFKELDSRFLQIDAHTEAAGKAVAERLGNKMDNFVKIVRERTEEVEDRFDSLSGRLADSGNKIIDSVNDSVNEIGLRAEDIGQRLQSTSDKVLSNFDEKFNQLDKSIIDRSNRSLNDFSEQIDRMEGRAHDFPRLFDTATKTSTTAFEKHMDIAEERYNSLTDKFNENGVKLTNSMTRNIEEMEKRSKEMDARLNMNSKTIMEVFENKLNAMDNLFVDRSNNSLNLFTEQITKLETKSDSLSSDFNSATQSAIRHFENRLDEVDNSLSRKSTSLIRSFIEKTESLEESTDKLNTALEIHVERVNEAFRSRASDITESLANGRNDILSIVDETKTRLSHEMEIVGTTIGKLVDERAGGFIYQFIEGREKLSHTLQDETAHIIDAVSSQMSRLSTYVADIEKNLLSRMTEIETQAHNHVNQLDSKTTEFEKSLTDTFGLTQEMIETQTQNIDIRAQALRDSLIVNSKELNIVLGEQAAALEARIAEIRRVVAESDNTFTEAMQSHVTAFGKSVSAGDTELRDIFLTHLQNLETQTARLKNGFSDNYDTLSETLDDKLEILQNLLSGGRESIENLLDKHGNVISERAVLLQKNLAQTLASVDEKLGKQSELLDKRAYDLRDAVDYNSTILSDSFLRQTAVIDERAKTIQKTLEIGVNNVRDVLEENTGNLSDFLRERLDNITERLTGERHKAESIITEATDKLLGSVFDAANNVDQKLANRGLAMVDALGHAGTRIDENMNQVETHLSGIADSFNIQADKVKMYMTDAGIKLSDSIIQSAEQADKTLSERSVDLQDNLAIIESRINYGLQAVQDNMLNTSSEVEQRLNDKSLIFKDNLRKISDDIGSGVDAIREHIAELTQDTTQQLMEKTGSLHGLTEQLKNAATRTSDSLANLTGTFSKQLHDVTRAAEERLRQENENFISTFSGRTEDAVFAVQNTKNELETQISRLLEELENSGSSVQLTVSNLHDNVNEVDKKLSSLTSTFRQNISELSENFTASGDVLNRDLQRFNNQSREAMDNIAKFAEQFDSHTRLLGEATNILESSNNLFTDKMMGNKENLNKLAEGLVSKSDEIANAMHNCEHAITSVIKNVKDEAWSSTEEIRTSLSTLINEAAGRFEGATEEIRKAANDIQEELTRTKTDLSRGIRSLPIQTKEYTDTMRKAILDQVEALKDLSGIVEESGLLFDAGKPRSTGTTKTPIKKPTATAARPTATSQPPSSVNGTGTYVAPALNTAREGHSNGWVSDLLARASKEDTFRSAPINTSPTSNHNGRSKHNDYTDVSLNSMSVEIVQAIDRDGITKLWQHYRRGQRNITPDKLYTPEGHHVFENIKHKYAYDGEFRRTVGQYINDFEHLLGDVAKNGGTNNTVRDYLTSDTGKVYTMLAHISGRIQ